MYKDCRRCSLVIWEMQVSRRKFAYVERHIHMIETHVDGVHRIAERLWQFSRQIIANWDSSWRTSDDFWWIHIWWLLVTESKFNPFLMISDDSISSDDFYPAGSPVVSALYLFSSRSVRIDPSSLRYVMYARWSEANDTFPAYQRTWGFSNIRNSNWPRPEVPKLFWNPIWRIW